MNDPLLQLTPSSPVPSRDEIDRLIAAGDAVAALDAIQSFWRATPGPATASFVVGRFEKLRGSLPLIPCKLAILRSFTIEPAVPLVRALAFLAGIDLDVQLGDFNNYSQEILNPASSLYARKPTGAILVVHVADVAPELWEGFADLDAAAVEAAVGRVSSEFDRLITTFRAGSQAHLIVHTLQAPAEPAAGALDAQMPLGQRDAIARINTSIAATARRTNNVYILDYNALVARRGEAQWEDHRKWLTVRMPIAAGELLSLARQWMRFLHPITGRVCKAVAVDLDNTLWGGVIGEDGIEGIKLGPDYPGAAWRDMQRALLDLYRRGIILAICSKNNPAEAMEAISRHPNMLLRPEQFAAVRINWNDKASNLREIAAELNIGIDAIAFLDDNPIERDWVRRQLPEVTVIDLPDDPMGFAPALRQCPFLERLSLSAEDRERGRMYADQRLRTELQQSAGSLEDFYRSLQMVVDIAPVTLKTLARAAQLTQKTNQFNLTTRRYSEEQLAELLRLPGWHAWTIRVVDRFGDNGIVGLAIVRTAGSICEIDNFLLSCRVIGRTVETAFLSTLAAAAANQDATRLVGRFIPTKKNVPAREFYRDHGFAPIGDPTTDGPAEWMLDLTTRKIPWPQWIEQAGDTPNQQTNETRGSPR